MRALSLLLLLSACTGFTGENDAALPDGDDDAGQDGGRMTDLSHSDRAIPDLSEPADLATQDLSTQDFAIATPIDFVCSEPWILGAARTHAECLSRKVVVIESGVADPQGISIARTAAGRVGISYEYPNGADLSELHVAVFTGVPSPSAAPITVLSDGPMDRVGTRSALAAAGADELHLAYLEVSDIGNAVNYCKIGACQSSSIEAVVSNFAIKGEVAIAVDPGDNVFVAAFNYNTGTLSSYKRTSTWSAAKIMKSAIDTSAAGAGQVRLLIDDSGLPEAVFHYTTAVGQAQPRYTEFDGTLWSTSKTLDNNASNGLYGFSIGHALFAGTHYAAYFGQSGANTVDVRLATWRAAADTPMVTVLEQALPVADFGNPLHRSAIAVDRFGLLHLVMVEPQAPSGGVLEYKRQTIVGGQLKWISDIIDDNAVGSGDPSLVDLTVDENGHPHIAYFNQATGKVLYATIE